MSINKKMKQNNNNKNFIIQTRRQKTQVEVLFTSQISFAWHIVISRALDILACLRWYSIVCGWL